MTGPPRKTAGKKRGTAREARLKAALKANIARRKAQSRARKDRSDGAGSTED